MSTINKENPTSFGDLDWPVPEPFSAKIDVDPVAEAKELALLQALTLISINLNNIAFLKEIKTKTGEEPDLSRYRYIIRYCGTYCVNLKEIISDTGPSFYDLGQEIKNRFAGYSIFNSMGYIVLIPPLSATVK